jgi:hypothetical protein
MKSIWSIAAVAAALLVMIGPAMAQAPDGGGPPGGQRRGPPSPERFVEHAMEFDADGDGKLDRSELTKFAEDRHAKRMSGGPGGPGGAGGPGGPQGNGQRRGPRGPRGGGPGGFGGGPGDGTTPQRPE